VTNALGRSPARRASQTLLGFFPRVMSPGAQARPRFAMKLQMRTQANSEWQACAEVVALRRVVHPFIVRLEQAFQTPQYYALLLELCPRGDVNRMICTIEDYLEGMPLQKCAKYGGQALLALLYVHETLGMIYRDVKPENLLISDRDEAKLADFGLARYVGDERGRQLPVAGTAGFLAPELILGGDDDDLSDAGSDGEYNTNGPAMDAFKTDAYSFGVTLEVMILGERCADLTTSDDGSMWMLPRRLSDDRVEALLNSECEKGQLLPEARDFLLELTPQKPTLRKRLADPAVKNHPFFMTTLNCTDLAEALMP